MSTGGPTVVRAEPSSPSRPSTNGNGEDVRIEYLLGWGGPTLTPPPRCQYTIIVSGGRGAQQLGLCDLPNCAGSAAEQLGDGQVRGSGCFGVSCLIWEVD